MSPSVDDALSQWTTKLVEMQAAIAELKRMPEPSIIPPYGTDIEEELLSSDIRPYKGDLLDLITKEYERYNEFEEEASSDDPEDITNGVPVGVYDEIWLRQQCQRVENQGSELKGSQLYDQMSAIIVSDSNGMYFN